MHAGQARRRRDSRGRRGDGIRLDVKARAQAQYRPGILRDVGLVEGDSHGHFGLVGRLRRRSVVSSIGPAKGAKAVLWVSSKPHLRSRGKGANKTPINPLPGPSTGHRQPVLSPPYGVCRGRFAAEGLEARKMLGKGREAVSTAKRT